MLRHRSIAVLLFGCVMWLTPWLHAMQAERPLPDLGPFTAAVRANLTRAQQEQGRYAYKERRTDVHMNPFGRIGTGGTRTFDVTPGPSRSVFFRRLIERDGMPVRGEPAERQERRSRSTSRSVIEDATGALTFAVDRRERLEGRDAIVLTFAGRPDARPETREGKLARLFRGSVWIDEQAHEVMRIEATAIDDITYGMGVLARLNRGTTVTVTRQPVAGGIWLPTSVRFKGEGRAMLLRKLTLDYVIEWFDYRLAGEAPR